MRGGTSTRLDAPHQAAVPRPLSAPPHAGDFEKIVEALKAVGYKGDFTLETVSYLEKHTEDNVFQGVKEMAETARKLADMFEK